MKFSRFFRSNKQKATATPLVCQKTYLRLFQLKRAHRLMWLRAEGDSNTYQTVILHVDTEEPFILIDEPFPVDGVLEGLIGKDVTLMFNEDGLQQEMCCQLIGRAGGEGSSLYQLSYPESVGARQRREMYRLPVETTNHVRINSDSLSHWVPEEDGLVVAPVVLDISVSGMRWAVPGNRQLDVYAGKTLTALDVWVVGCGEFTVDFDVTHSQWVPSLDSTQSDHTVVGGSFVGLGVRQKQQLERYITLIQRQQCREKRDDRLLAA
ncbi:hypothetical protein A9Q81_13435 [Gammaproteobacteria bacterium 42_54_T18]|nr:hypothetical protein A9Q81_13435 [Gammaproteobacteria bacterium 42_54_T18]